MAQVLHIIEAIGGIAIVVIAVSLGVMLIISWLDRHPRPRDCRRMPRKRGQSSHANEIDPHSPPDSESS